jgi:hypothetical protein
MRNDLCYVSMVEEDYMFHDSDVQCVKSLKRSSVSVQGGGCARYVILWAQPSDSTLCCPTSS